MAATITLVGEDDTIVISGPGADQMTLDVDPKGIYSTGFTLRTEQGAREVGGRVTGNTVPIREITAPIDLWDVYDEEGERIPVSTAKWRLQRLFGSPPRNLKKVVWQHEAFGETRELVTRLAKEIEFTTDDGYDETLDGDHIHAVLSLACINPMYEGEAEVQVFENPSAGEHTGYFEVWNPTDQPLWLEWIIDPCDEASFPDFSHGQERMMKRAPGADATRMVVTPELVAILHVRVDRQMRTYRSADNSNITPLFDGVEPVYPVPPYTGTEDDPIIYPVTINGPAGAKITLIQRRFWSAESGLHAPEPEVGP